MGPTEIEAALDTVELYIAAGDSHETAEVLAECAEALQAVREPGLLARATWLAGFAALLEGEQDAFREQVGRIADRLDIADGGDDGVGARLGQRVADIRWLSTGGLPALCDLVHRITIDLVAGMEARWREPTAADLGTTAAPFDCGRLAIALAYAEHANGAAPPLLWLQRRLGFDAVETAILAVLGAIDMSTSLTVRVARLSGTSADGVPADVITELLFGASTERYAAIARLQPNGRLRTHGMVRALEQGIVAPGRERIAIDAEVCSYLYGLHRPDLRPPTRRAASPAS